MEIEKSMFAWVTEVNGKVTLVGACLFGMHTPLIASSREAIERFRHIAISHAGALKQPLRLVRLQEVETLEEYDAAKKEAAH